MSEARAGRYHAGLHCALVAGRDILADGGSALDAVTAAVVALEDDPLFNAGRGAVFTAAGGQEMDAAVMDGSGSLWMTLTRGPMGRQRAGELPNSAIVGTPMMPARCAGPLSFPMKDSAVASSASRSRNVAGR